MRPPECEPGDAALARGAWADARQAYESALASAETPEALEGLGLAAWWLDLAEVVFDARERSYRLYLSRDDCVSATRLAVWLAWDYCAFHGEHAVASGWLQPARRHLAGQPHRFERAWLELREGALALLDDGDPDRAHALATTATEVAQSIGSIDLEMLGRALQGLALVSSGAVAEGLRGLDEVNAAVVAGELTDLVAIGLASCYMIAACNRVRDQEHDDVCVVKVQRSQRREDRRLATSLLFDLARRGRFRRLPLLVVSFRQHPDTRLTARLDDEVFRAGWKSRTTMPPA